MKKIKTLVASELMEVLRHRIRLPLLDRCNTSITLETPAEAREFADAAAYWSQPHSVGDDNWSSENQRRLETVLTDLLAQFLSQGIERPSLTFRGRA